MSVVRYSAFQWYRCLEGDPCSAFEVYFQAHELPLGQALQHKTPGIWRTVAFGPSYN